MPNRIFTHRTPFKVLLLLVFSIFYFVQVQASFIACAYNDYPTLSSAKQSHGFTISQKGKETKALAKLNKRYQAADFVAILPLTVEVEKPFCSIEKEWQQFFFDVPINYPYCLSLRGPPAFD
ncbi:hypothetical protein [Pinibacter aurantiacus]|uniref:Uncharacterized protein n=1 Tax=Pinibacter aurantiacus TaxID=2851599 RepID=A0A9E2W5T2_9BACT|nr:hypothetical protein [Pinibacter aurantiacus]MBV4358998.1 hypothetical protein [Pinibacter aurantiacus]